jgi:hypothetical protein
MMEKAEALWTTLEEAGCKQEAVAALRRAGYTAWQNQSGDMAVLPPPGALDARG